MYIYLIYVRYIVSKSALLLWKTWARAVCTLEGHSISHTGRMESFLSEGTTFPEQRAWDLLP